MTELAIIPSAAVAGIVNFVAIIWSWLAMVIAVRQALDYKSTWRAVGVTFIGFILNIIIVGVIASIFLAICPSQSRPTNQPLQQQRVCWSTSPLPTPGRNRSKC